MPPAKECTVCSLTRWFIVRTMLSTLHNSESTINYSILPLSYQTLHEHTESDRAQTTISQADGTQVKSGLDDFGQSCSIFYLPNFNFECEVKEKRKIREISAQRLKLLRPWRPTELSWAYPALTVTVMYIRTGQLPVVHAG